MYATYRILGYGLHEFDTASEVFVSSNMLFHPFLDFSLGCLLALTEDNVGTGHLFVLAVASISNKVWK